MAVRLWGSQFQVNGSSTFNQDGSSVTALRDGGFVVVWHDDMGSSDDRVYFQRFDALGHRVGSETLVPSDGGPQDLPSVAAFRDGGFIIGVRDNDGPSDHDAMGYRFTAQGVLAETIFVAGFIDAGAAVFSDNYVSGTDLSFYSAHRIGAAGNGEIFLGFRTPGSATASGLQANALTADDQRDPVIAASEGNRYAAIAWVADGGSGFNDDVMLRVYDTISDGFTTTQEIPLRPDVKDASGLQLAWITSDILVVSFTAVLADLREGLAYLYSASSGVFREVDFNIGGANPEPDVTALGDGRFAISWSQTLFPAGVPAGETEIRVQIYNSDGSAYGSEIVINTDYTGWSRQPSVAMLADGRVVVTWTDLEPGGGIVAQTGIFSQIIDPRDGLVTGSNDPARAETLVGHSVLSDEIRGLRGDDTLWGLAGNDSLYGGDGNDTAHGGKGDDEIYGGRGNDLLIGGQGDDDLFGEAGNDTFRAGAGADLFNGGVGEDVVEYFSASAGVRVALDGSLVGTGDAAGDSFSGIERIRGSNFADTLRGDASANVLIGEGGGDVLQGLAGNDILRGNAGADSLTGGANVDTFQYFAVTEGGDSITDFSAADDRFQFLGSAFGGLPAGALDASRFQSGTDPNALAAGGNVRFYYETDTRTLWYDADGLNGGAIAIATLQTGASMTVADIFIA